MVQLKMIYLICVSLVLYGQLALCYCGYDLVVDVYVVTKQHVTTFYVCKHGLYLFWLDYSFVVDRVQLC